MRIAFCFSGQPRTWEKCYPSISKMISSIEKKLNAKADLFCHLWDFNSISHTLIDPVNVKNLEIDFTSIPSNKIPSEEKLKILNTIKPVSFLIGTEEENRKKWKEITIENEKYSSTHGNSLIHWASPQFYSIMLSSHLKKRYELEKNFRYDACFRMRYDLFFDEHQIDFFSNGDFEDLQFPKHNTIYPCHSRNFKVGDIFWYADSTSFDRICDFYRWIPVIGKKCLPHKENIGTEDAFHFYIKMLKMNIRSLHLDPKILRPDDFLEMQEKFRKNAKAGKQGII